MCNTRDPGSISDHDPVAWSVDDSFHFKRYPERIKDRRDGNKFFADEISCVRKPRSIDERRGYIANMDSRIFDELSAKST